MPSFLKGRSYVMGAELSALSAAGPYRLAFHHPNGCIVEYFDHAAAALVRGVEIEEWLLAHAPRAIAMSESALAEPRSPASFSPAPDTERC